MEAKELFRKYATISTGVLSTWKPLEEESLMTFSQFQKAFDEIVSQIEPPIMRFAKPTINNDDFNKWLSDKKFYAESDDTKLDKDILQSYYDTVGQFINSPESKATKSVFEIATQTIKKYLKQNV